MKVEATVAGSERPDGRREPPRLVGLLVISALMGVFGLLAVDVAFAGMSMVGDTAAERDAVMNAHNPWVVLYGGGAVTAVTCWVLALAGALVGRWRRVSLPLAVSSMAVSAALILTLAAEVAAAIVGLVALI